MTPDGLREELDEDRLRPAYLVVGPDALLREDAIRALRAAVLGPGPTDFDHDRLDGADASPGRLLDAVRTLPVLAPRRLVELREPEARRGGAVEALPDAVAAASAGEGAVVLAIVAEKVDGRARWVKAFRTSGEGPAKVACDPPRRPRELVAFARAEARRQDVALGPGAAEALAEAVGPQLMVVRRELEKLALWVGPGGTATREHVARSVTAVAEEPIWDLTDAIGEGRTADALAVLDGLLGGGAPHVMVLGSLAGHFRRLLRTRAGATPPGHPFVQRKLESQARRYPPARLERCLDAIHDVDEVLKGQGHLPPTLALERLVMGLSG